jgi:hypothetical protein
MRDACAIGTGRSDELRLLGILGTPETREIVATFRPQAEHKLSWGLLPRQQPIAHVCPTPQRTGATRLKRFVGRGYQPVVTHLECSGKASYGSQLWVPLLAALDF